MNRYSATGKTVGDLIKALQDAVNHGLSPNSEIQAWDPDVESWEAITGFSMDNNYVRFYTDEP